MTRPTLHLSNRDARRLLLGLQGLCDDPRGGLDASKLLSLVERLGYVQVDSIQAVARAHDHILFSRAQSYRPALLKRLLETERALFEHWTHDASVIPTSFYPHWKHRFARARARIRADRGWWAERLKDGAAIAPVRAHLQAHGPTRARDLDSPGHVREAWWGWAPHKAALEYLWFTGEAAIAGRERFEKIYDLSPRVIPAAQHGAETEYAETVDWAARVALTRLGAATPGQIADFFKLITPEAARAWAAAQRDLVTVTYDAADGGLAPPLLALPDVVAQLEAQGEPPARLRALSPFDPVLRDRTRATRLFGFDYRIEIFVPAAKRSHGYYVLPLLEGDSFVGRIDLKADRKASVLLVQGFWPEHGARFGKDRRAKLDSELARLATFAGVDTVRWANGVRTA